jgi:tetrahydromethanopterin S-methyltransferase subunit A
MKPKDANTADAPWLEAASQLQHAAQAAKCWKCGCLHATLAALEGTPALSDAPTPWKQAIADARSRLQTIEYDCRGCRTCFPALAGNALASALGEDSLGSGCVVQPADTTQGMATPSGGSYTALRYRAPVAICTLTDSELCDRIREASPAQASLVGTLQTENLGIERLLLNVLANPYIRFVLLCGSDSQQAVGHLPGQSSSPLPDRASTRALGSSALGASVHSSRT